MLTKLLKYDLKWVYKPLIVFYIIALIFSFLVRIVESFESALILLIIDKICCGVVISMFASILINCFMRNFARFIKNVYKDEAYLTHTLPVSKNNIYLSKVLTGIITLLSSFIIIIICLIICALNENTLELIKEILESSAIYFDSSVFGLIFVMVTIIFFEFLFMMLSGIIGIIIGHRASNLKIVKSIIVGFSVYFLLSILSVGILYLVGLIRSDIMNIFSSTMVSSSTLKYLMIIFIFMYGIYDIGLYFVGNIMLNRGVDVE